MSTSAGRRCVGAVAVPDGQCLCGDGRPALCCRRCAAGAVLRTTAGARRCVGAGRNAARSTD
ncbi:MAG: hypothetical protein ACYS7Y_30480 [Planctomycetota bacterium]